MCYLTDSAVHCDSEATWEKDATNTLERGFRKELTESKEERGGIRVAGRRDIPEDPPT